MVIPNNFLSCYSHSDLCKVLIVFKDFQKFFMEVAFLFHQKEDALNGV